MKSYQLRSAFLALAVTSALAFGGQAFAEGGGCPMHDGKGDKGDRLEKMKEELGLTDEQAAQIKTIKEQKKAAMEKAHEDIKAVLTEEQRAKLDAKKAEWKEKRGEYKKEHKEHKKAE